MEQDAQIIVAGAGPAGLISALALANAGFSVNLVGPRPTAEDRRTTAVMSPALRFLGELGIEDELRREAAPLRVMRIIDATTRLIRSPTVTFRAAEIGEDAFGLNIPNSHLLEVLWASVEAQPGIIHHETTVRDWKPGEGQIAVDLANGDTLSARLAAAADGRNSPARAAAGIEARPAGSGQVALVLNFAHQRPHDDMSTEFHTESGPFTQVPLPGRRSSLVWVLRPAAAEEIARLDDADLGRRIEERMQSMLGRVTVEPGRQTYPLASALPTRFAARRIALVGEAAHLFPPIGAQGLNLSIRDVQELTRIASENAVDPGCDAALADYDRRRRPDILARSSAVAILNSSLLSDLLPAQLARATGLGLLGSIAPLRAFFMREGMRTGGGFGALFAGSGK